MTDDLLIEHSEDDPDAARSAWLNWRRGGIGGSDIAAIAEVEGAFGTPYSVWLSKVHGVDSDESEPMLWGSLVEDVILNEAERRLGLVIGSRQMRLEHPEAPHHRATLDGAAYESQAAAAFCDLSSAVAGIEAKNTGFRQYPGNEPPLAYYCQAQWQMWCGNFSQVVLTVLHAGTRLELYTIERDDDDIAVLVDHADRFWTEHVLAGVPPSLSHRDSGRVRSFIGDTDGSVIYADDVTADLIVQLQAAKEAAKAAAEREERLSTVLVSRIGAAETVLSQTGIPLAHYKPSRWFDLEHAVGLHADTAAACQRLDVDAFKKAIGKKALETFMRPADAGSPRRLTLPKQKETPTT